AFCPGSSSRLASQMMIEDQMTSHYNRISSAKAAVDSSLPKSLLTSVKYRDQQRRAWLRKEVRHAEQDLRSNTSLSRSGSRPASASTTSPSRAWVGERPSESTAFYPPRYTSAPLPRSGDALALPQAMKLLFCKLLNNSSERPSEDAAQGNRAASAPERPHRDARGRALAGGDVLEKHAESFTTAERPFTPRVLRSDASAALLARTRHYAPPRRRARQPPAGKTFVERDAQTDPDRVAQNMEMKYQSKDHRCKKNQHHSYTRLAKEELCTPGCHQSQRLVWNGEEPFSIQCLLERRYAELAPLWMPGTQVDHREEELKYLQFIGQVTDDILAMGLFSNSVLVRVFERHVEKNRHRLEETKMRHMLEVLKSDLG
uniref:Spermatogenesis associated 7 n=1 Tax=Petromyzon marinus TaxID=7757 RepID=S4RPM1_PETMA